MSVWGRGTKFWSPEYFGSVIGSSRRGGVFHPMGLWAFWLLFQETQHINVKEVSMWWWAGGSRGYMPRKAMTREKGLVLPCSIGLKITQARWKMPSLHHACMLSHFRSVQLCTTLWNVAHQVSPSMGFPRQEYWSGLPCPPPEDLPDPGIKPTSLLSPAWAGAFFTTSATWEACHLSSLTPHIHEKQALLWAMGLGPRWAGDWTNHDVDNEFIQTGRKLYQIYWSYGLACLVNLNNIFCTIFNATALSQMPYR